MIRESSHLSDISFYVCFANIDRPDMMGMYHPITNKLEAHNCWMVRLMLFSMYTDLLKLTFFFVSNIGGCSQGLYRMGEPTQLCHYRCQYPQTRNVRDGMWTAWGQSALDSADVQFFRARATVNTRKKMKTDQTRLRSWLGTYGTTTLSMSACSSN